MDRFLHFVHIKLDILVKFDHEKVEFVQQNLSHLDKLIVPKTKIWIVALHHEVTLNEVTEFVNLTVLNRGGHTLRPLLPDSPVILIQLFIDNLHIRAIDLRIIKQLHVRKSLSGLKLRAASLITLVPLANFNAFATLFKDTRIIPRSFLEGLGAEGVACVTCILIQALLLFML